jgi:hypothetical protein
MYAEKMINSEGRFALSTNPEQTEMNQFHMKR